MQKRIIDILVGLFMIAGIMGLLVLAYRVSSFSNYQANSTYTLTADFDNVGGLKVRAPISIGGVKIGQVSGISLDRNTFRAKVILLIDDRDNNLPIDTSASIYTQGLLGSNYISLSPGFSNESLKDGGVIATTRSALILEDLIGQLMFKLTGDSDKKNSSDNSSNNTDGSNNANSNNTSDSTAAPAASTPAANTQPGTAAT